MFLARVTGSVVSTQKVDAKSIQKQVIQTPKSVKNEAKNPKTNPARALPHHVAVSRITRKLVAFTAALTIA